MKSKFKIILLTMFFITCFGVLAYAEEYPKFVPPSDQPYFIIRKIDSGYVAYSCTMPFFGHNKSIWSVKGSKTTQFYCANGSSSYKWDASYENDCGIDSKGTFVSNQDIYDKDGKIFFQQPRAPHWTDKVTLGGMITQVRPIAIVAGGFLVLVIALRKGFNLLKTVLKGL